MTLENDLPANKRLELLRQAQALSSLGSGALNFLCDTIQEVRFTSGQPIISEGDYGDRAFLIVNGSAEVTAAGEDGPMVLAKLAAGELFGELALYSSTGKRTASVTAVTQVHLLSISGTQFRQAVDQDSDAHAQFENTMEKTLLIRFLKLAASPFSTMSDKNIRDLVSKLKLVKVQAGDEIIRQGEDGTSCYLIRDGEVDVVTHATADSEEKVVATLGPGSLFGEAALLTCAPRNATVKATGPCDLLVLERQDLIGVLGEDAALTMHLRELLQMRARPCQVEKIIAVHNKSLSGEEITILKNTRRNVYYRLSPQGWFIWQRLDGKHTLKELTFDYMKEFKAFAPQAIAETVSRLAQAGFVTSPGLRADIAGAVKQLSKWQRLVRASRAVLELQLTLRNVDKPITKIYAAGIFLFYTKAAQVLMLTTAVAGMVSFIALSSHTARTVSVIGPQLLLFLIPASYISLLLHEAGHAFTTKFYKREVLGIGIGWYWFSMVAFVDTSDMWLGTRKQRIVVSCAGPYANFILGSIGAAFAWFTPDPVVQAILWQFAFASYVSVLVNLNPLLEYDGYYILSDALDRPDFRKEALSWLGTDLIGSLRERKPLSGHAFEIVFGIASILFIFVMAALTLITYRILLQHWIASLIPAWIAGGMAWVFAGTVVLLSSIRIAGDLKNARE